MMFKAISAFTLTLIAAVCAQVDPIPVGGLCDGVTGPTGTCIYGSICCAVEPDLSLCAALTKCPKEFLKEGDLCSGFAGPKPFPCIPGTVCCNVSPDQAICKTDC